MVDANMRHTGMDGSRKTRLDIEPASEVRHRTIQNTPLKEFDLTAPARIEDFQAGNQWPPVRLHRRNERLRVFRDLYNGDYSYFINDPMAFRIAPNWFMLIVDRLCDLLMSTLVGTNMDRDLRKNIRRAILEYYVMGRLHCVQIGDQRFVPRAEQCFLSEDQQTLFVVTQDTVLPSEDGRPNALVISAVGQGTSSTWTAALSSSDNAQVGHISQISDAIEADGNWASTDYNSDHAQWGRSGFLPYYTLILGIALRFSGNEAVLSKHQRLVMKLKASVTDVAKFLSTTDTYDTKDWTPAEITSAAYRLLDNDVVAGENESFDMEYVNPDLRRVLEPATAYIQELLAALRQFGGINALLDSDSLTQTSGVALRESHMPLYWMAAPIHEEVHATMQEIWDPFPWESPFDPKEDPSMPNEEGDGETDVDTE